MKSLRMFSTAIAVAAAVSGPAIAAVAQAPLRIWAIDVEGGAATLYVTPQGHSLLIDTGWPAGLGGAKGAPPSPSSAQRIAAIARQAGLSRLDYVLITHYHVDHVGGAAELAGLMPIGTFLDHGPNREVPPAGATPAQLAYATATLYPTYAAIAAKHHRRVLAPGQSVRIDGLTIDVVDSDRAVPSRLLPGAGDGAPGLGCAAATSKAQDGGEENPRSLGVLLTYGQARILALGDTTWDVENRLICPRNLIGRIDLMMADHHGSALSNSPVFLDAVTATVSIVANGATKGGDAEALTHLRAASGADAVWQVHYATRSGDQNAPADQIANLADEADAMRPLAMAVSTDGTVRVTNPRTGLTRAYPKATVPR